jgi:hypothetical protein
MLALLFRNGLAVVSVPLSYFALVHVLSCRYKSLVAFIDRVRDIFTSLTLPSLPWHILVLVAVNWGSRTRMMIVHGSDCTHCR